MTTVGSSPCRSLVESRIACGRSKAGPGAPRTARRGRGAFPIKLIKQYRESSVKPPNHIFFRNSYVAKFEVDDVCAVHPKETIRLHHLPSFRFPRDNNGADSRLGRLSRLSDGEDEEEIGNSTICDETLLTVEYEILPSTFCVRLDRGRV